MSKIIEELSKNFPHTTSTIKLRKSKDLEKFLKAKRKAEKISRKINRVFGKQQKG